MIEKHREPGQKLKALAFCRDISHAIRMSQAMEDYYHTRYLPGKNSVGERVRAYKDLQDDAADLEILFTVDILNEGVDIPGVNMVLFLRPTDSQTIFIQQLGRGLRKYEGKKSMRNDQGQHSQRYYIENTHEAIISQEAFDEAQQVRGSRKNAKMVGRTQPQHEFTGMIECGCCGKHFNRKMNATGLKWSAPVWTCYTQTKFTVAACDNSRIKENVLHEKFIEAYNRFIKERPTGETVSNLVNRVRTLEAEEHELAALALQHMITEAAFHKEQLRIKAEVTKLNDEIADQRNRSIGEEDLTTITEYDPEKVKKFITKVIVLRYTITFVFYNGAEIKMDYSNGQPGNKPGWNGKTC